MPLITQGSGTLLTPAGCSPDQVLQSFRALATAHNGSIPRQQLQEFVHQHFRSVGQELLAWTPEDWKDRYSLDRG